MNRSAALHEITGLFGDVLRGFEAAGTPLDDRTVRLFVDAFCDRYKALPETDLVAKARLLTEAVDSDERNHGGLLSRGTLVLNMRLMLEMK